MRKWIIPLIVITMTITGCALMTPANTKDKGPDFPVLLLNQDLHRTLEVVDVENQKDQENLLFFQAKLRNLTNNEILHIQVQTVWRDVSGMPLSDESAWTTLTLTPQQETSFTQTASSPQAEYFTLKIRYLPPVIPDSALTE